MATATLVAASLAACAQKKEDEKTDANETGGGIAGGGTSGSGGRQTQVSASIDSLAALGLSKSLEVSLPRTGSALFLQQDTTKQSREACELRQTSRRVLAELNYMRAELCHIEVESEVIEFGRRYTASWGEGEDAGSYGVWVDNSVPGRLTVQICSDGQLTQKYVITGGDGSVLRGTMKARRVWTNTYVEPNVVQTTQIGGAFDNGVTDANRRRAGLVTRITSTDGHDNLVSGYFNLREDGVSLLRSAHTSNSGWSAVAAMKLDATGGMAMIGTAEDVYRSFFGADGLMVAADGNEAFAENGRLSLSPEDLTPRLPLEFNPAEFTETDWDCSGGEAWPFNHGGARTAAHLQCNEIANAAIGEEVCSDAETYSWYGGPDTSANVEAVQEDPIAVMEAAVEADDNLD